MNVIVAIVGILLSFSVLLDAFETVILPRRVTRPFRITRMVLVATWRPWRAIAGSIPPGTRREGFLSYYGPLSLLFLLATWALGLVFGFALLQFAFGSQLIVPYGQPSFGTDLYMSGTTFVTLGLGDVAPHATGPRALVVIEAATGFAFLALVISYVPVLYQSFSRREVTITLLDARAGSPPSGVEMLRRFAHDDAIEGLQQFLREWELWAAEVLESHLSYPNLVFYRSQHDNQSWLAALTAVLDACALILAGLEDVPANQARLTFAIARHTAVDLSQVLGASPHAPDEDRLPPEKLARVRQILADAGTPLLPGAATEDRLVELRSIYEPYVHALASSCLLTLPDWSPSEGAIDDWERTAWDRLYRRGERTVLN